MTKLIERSKSSFCDTPSKLAHITWYSYYFPFNPSFPSFPSFRRFLASMAFAILIRCNLFFRFSWQDSPHTIVLWYLGVNGFLHSSHGFKVGGCFAWYRARLYAFCLTRWHTGPHVLRLSSSRIKGSLQTEHKHFARSALTMKADGLTSGSAAQCRLIISSLEIVSFNSPFGL